MMKNFSLSALMTALFLIFAGLTAGFAETSLPSGHDTAAAEKSWVLSFIESKISSPNRQIRFTGIEGALSSNATIGSITVADRQGIWLKITNAKLDWNRLALLRGQVSINELSAEKIDIFRKPLPDSSAPSPQSKGFSIPDLPVAISIKSLDAKKVAFGEALFGLPSEVSLNGGITLADGDLAARLVMKRLDKAGDFDVLADISNSTNKAKIDIEVSEPENGIVANLLTIKNRPSLALIAKGEGPLDNFELGLAMKAGADPVLNGKFKLQGTENGKSINVNLSGPIVLLMPDEYRAFFGARTELELDALLKHGGGFRLDKFSINGDGVHIAANAETLSDGFLRRLAVKASVKAQTGGSLILPVAGGNTRADDIALNIDYGRNDSPMWSGQFIVNNFANENFVAHDITVDMGGDEENLDDVNNRHVGLQITGAINGMATPKSKISDALGKSVNLKVDADILAHQPVTIRTVNLSANGLTLWLKGQIEKFQFKGNLGIQADTLEPLAMLSGRPLSGAADIEANGIIGLVGGSFDLDLSGKTVALKTGNETLDRLLAGDVKLLGGIKRDENGITTRDLLIGNDHIKLEANGSFSSDEADMDYQLALSDLNLVNSRMHGAVQLRGAARGHNRLVALSLGAKIKEATLSGEKMQDTAIFANAVLDNTSPVATYLSGSVNGTGLFGGEKLKLSGSFSDNDRFKSLNNLDILVGETHVNGNLKQNLKGLIDGNIHIDARDISTLSALLLTDGHGAMTGDFNLSESEGKQSGRLKAHIDKLVFGENHVESLDMNLTLDDPKGAFRVNGFVNASDIRVANFVVNTIKATAKDMDGKTAFQVSADVQNNIKADLAGRLIYPAANGDNGQNGQGDNRRLTVALDSLNVAQDTLHAKLTNPASVILFDNSYHISPLILDVNGGKFSIKGDGGAKLDLELQMDHLPVSLANLIKPDLRATGTLTGQADIKGTPDKPDVAFDVKGEGLSIGLLKDKKIAPFALDAKGRTNGKLVNIDTKISGSGLDVEASGKVPLDGGNLDLDINLKNLPVALANSFVSNQNLGGTVSGHAHIGGQLKAPTATFNLSGQGLRADLLAKNGLTPISLNAEAHYENNVLNLEQFNANGPQGLNMSANGRIPVKGDGIDLHVKGSAPMGIANQFLAERGAQVSGSANVDATVRGSFTKPELNGHFALANGTFIDPQSNLRLNNIVVDAGLSGERIVLNRANASSSAGGTISANGSISTDFAAGMPADMTVRLNHTRYSDGEMVVATVDGTLTVTGGLLNNPVIGGDLTIEKAEITVPDRFGGAALIDVKHKNLTKDIETTLERAKIDTGRNKAATAPAKPSVVQLKLHIRAPNQIFVRGMGLDVELGGEIGLFGPVNEIHPVGGFQMLRGRFEILSQRLTFTEGTVTLVGNLNPEVNFVATTQGSDITVTVTVSGTINALSVSFTSVPVLPQDEVLARLIFNRSISELSPFQIAQLASAAAELAGVTNTSLLGSLRSTTGLDDLDVVTDKQGNTGVKAGRYIRDNIYLGVEAGSGGNTKGTVNLDISKNLKAKGALGAQGDSSVGVFYEKDY
ncbi:translocation/assembly module TamB domain-containing protein [Bartonella sp. B10834G6]|uniref:translocation/assembly module TamB domain-containing protein n=1 Tax=Bartonella apis TaxID=1686310 RepID=UPI0018DE2918|nr:translocation/assembly module TamB domain-containing protein [Bartonella apis]MBH9981553.1 translocation/assembly module TamB domain-containing protein [Bartonella apis]